jgi:hypothetical protein
MFSNLDLKSCDNSESSKSVSRRGSNDVENSDDFRGSGRLEKGKFKQVDSSSTNKFQKLVYEI